MEMMDEEDVEKACKRDRDHMGHRYIEGTVCFNCVLHSMLCEAM